MSSLQIIYEEELKSQESEFNVNSVRILKLHPFTDRAF